MYAIRRLLVRETMHLCGRGLDKKVSTGLRQLAPAARGSRDAGSRNFEPAISNILVLC